MVNIGTFGEPCAEKHVAAIYDRGGVSRLSQIVDLNQVQWGRGRNVVSEAQILVTGRSCDRQREVLNDIEPRRHELVIFRGTERVWEGPIVQSSTVGSVATIIAKDVGEYFNGTILSKRWPNSANGGPELMTDRIDEILTWEMMVPYVAEVGTELEPESVTIPRWENLGVDARWPVEEWGPPANVLPYLEVRAGTVLTRSDTQPFEMMVMEHLQDLARSGVDFTTVGRKFLVWDTENVLGRTRQLTEADFTGQPEVILSGGDFAALFHISATRDQDSGGEQVGVGNAGRPDPYYGVWTMMHTAESEQGDASNPDQWALNTQARRGIAGRNPVPMELRMPGSAGLQLSHDLTINELVPGTEMPVLAMLNLRKISQTQILDKMDVSEDASGETVSVTLVPSGAAQEVA